MTAMHTISRSFSTDGYTFVESLLRIPRDQAQAGPVTRAQVVVSVDGFAEEVTTWTSLDGARAYFADLDLVAFYGPADDDWEEVSA